MNGTDQSKITVTLRNPLDHNDLFEYYITPDDTQLARDWIIELKQILQSKLLLEKNFCFLGWPKTARTLEYLCTELNQSIKQINKFSLSGKWYDAGLEVYLIEEHFSLDSIRFSDDYGLAEGGKDDPYLKTIGMFLKQDIMNRIHNHFERLQGTVWNLSEYYKLADYETKYAIRQLNILCHEIEGLVLSQRKLVTAKEWVRPSQITTFLHSSRHNLTDEHKQGFETNGYDRQFGHVYMHWTQIGKTLFEVWRDEHAPKLTIGDDPTDITINTGTTCEAINSLKYYSGEFDVEWGRDVMYGKDQPWHTADLNLFYKWLDENNIEKDKSLSLGYLPLGHVELYKSFGTTDPYHIWNIMSNYLDIYKIEVDGISSIFDYCWTDSNYKQQQIDMMKPGYDFSSRGR